MLTEKIGAFAEYLRLVDAARIYIISTGTEHRRRMESMRLVI